MNLNTLKKLVFLILGIAAIQSCKEDLDFKEPSIIDKTVPGVVSNISVENLSGKAKISYSIPADKNLLYVKAVYTLATGQAIEVRSSSYNNSLMVEGFADTKEHEITLYSVSRSEVLSDPVAVKVTPLEAPIWKVFKSMVILNAFGGYNLAAENPTKGNISILVMKKNVIREFEVDNQKSVFTSTDVILSKIRGLDTTSSQFAFFVKDRWGNSTDTLYKDIKPIFEAELSITKFRTLVLPGDAPQVTNGAVGIPGIWDGKYGWPYTSFTHQVNGGPLPHMITFDTGVLAKLSRVWIRPFPEGTRWYYLSTMKKFEIYGSVSPNLTGALDGSWILLGTYELNKPSGLPYGTDSAEDQATAAAGFSWDVDLTAPKIRYLRIRCIENFAGGTAQSINELKVYGDPRN
ncbi:DUF4959 domain-containing protein [Pedobacter metabolipauper]|uniref:Uncharacterized protein DUF5126 n=1 Tax=Pedobacter metabolipauper TaxID=425513 RepID=A0A4V3D139_9SPHI|nr:DUF4959 domain-containing protein [Pedobacter metabolipauper]TDQ08904.1 uncharacterized protein DUF5126 [Pedobacter metabolipauper]